MRACACYCTCVRQHNLFALAHWPNISHHPHTRHTACSLTGLGFVTAKPRHDPISAKYSPNYGRVEIQILTTAKAHTPAAGLWYAMQGDIMTLYEPRQTLDAMGVCIESTPHYARDQYIPIDQSFYMPVLVPPPHSPRAQDAAAAGALSCLKRGRCRCLSALSCTCTIRILICLFLHCPGHSITHASYCLLRMCCPADVILSPPNPGSGGFVLAEGTTPAPVLPGVCPVVVCLGKCPSNCELTVLCLAVNIDVAKPTNYYSSASCICMVHPQRRRISIKHLDENAVKRINPKLSSPA